MAYVYRFELGMGSVDAAGLIFFPELFRHAHDAYERFMKENGLALDRLLRDGDYLLPIVHAEADYRRPLRHGASVSVHLGIDRIGESSFVVGYEFADEAGESCARCQTVHVAMDRESGRPHALPEPLRACLATHARPADD